MAYLKKLMRDSATGKLMRDSATGKLMRWSFEIGNDCGYCDTGKTPASIQIILSGYSTGSGCYQPYGGDYAWDIVDINGTYTLSQTGNPCLWSYQNNADFGDRIKYPSGSGCVGEFGRDMLTPFYITAQKIDANTVQVKFWFIATPYALCLHTCDLTVTSGCVNTAAESCAVACGGGNGLDGGNVRVYE